MVNCNGGAFKKCSCILVLPRGYKKNQENPESLVRIASLCSDILGQDLVDIKKNCHLLHHNTDLHYKLC
jgi:hypothetical protein